MGLVPTMMNRKPRRTHRQGRQAGRIKRMACGAPSSQARGVAGILPPPPPPPSGMRCPLFPSTWSRRHSASSSSSSEWHAVPPLPKHVESQAFCLLRVDSKVKRTSKLWYDASVLPGAQSKEILIERGEALQV
ncbi:hypothetical protein MUK42_27035 [Musa troglodytarum]|uniref:Uncharacterized protein n=1 Tax=Musa troglodytarum TaxID=320322 RepID=A0A9E7FRI5_9LILI|nr:hypothetical protein MUK42_27035 [Musa troglodytarum]